MTSQDYRARVRAWLHAHAPAPDPGIAPDEDRKSVV